MKQINRGSALCMICLRCKRVENRMTVCAETTKVNKVLARENLGGEGMWSVDRQGGLTKFSCRCGPDAVCACEKDPHVLSSLSFSLSVFPASSLFAFDHSLYYFALSLVAFPRAAISVSLAHAGIKVADHRRDFTLFSFSLSLSFSRSFFVLFSVSHRSLSFARASSESN